ncbi:MAG: hypothetical protein LCI02_04995 [Proteobacteria bacterium]|nr:hypothetical protein [Pseudomonadota bacterium]
MTVVSQFLIEHDPVDVLDACGYWAPVELSADGIRQIHAAALAAAAEQPSIRAGVQHVSDALRQARLTPLGKDHAAAIRSAIVWAKALALHSDRAQASAWFDGHEHFCDGAGHDLGPYWVAEEQFAAWEAGRDASPDYPLHKAAQSEATEYLASRFNGLRELTTKKANACWVRGYRRALDRLYARSSS